MVNTLLTALSTVLAGLCVWMTWSAGLSRERCDRIESRLTRRLSDVLALQGQIHALANSLENLQTQHRKLRGAFYAERAVDPRPEFTSERETPPSQLGVCENWNRAQIEGPRSEAAKCACLVCEGLRARRATEKAAILARERIGRAQYEASKANGGE